MTFKEAMAQARELCDKGINASVEQEDGAWVVTLGHTPVHIATTRWQGTAHRLENC